MRLFVAIELPEESRKQMRAAVSAARPRLPQARWVPEENLHLTLLFLGERPGAERRAIDRALRPVFAAERPFRLQPSGSGTFPPGSRPRVAWVGLAAEPTLARLHEAARRALARALGLPEDRRPFRPHVTLARCRQPWPRDARRAWQEVFAGASLEPFGVDRGALMESRLGPRGASYSVAGAYPLAASEEPS